jgi:putative DNA primase/helicase
LHINEEKKTNWNDYRYPSQHRINNGNLVNGDGDFVCGTPFVLCAKTPALSDGSLYYMIRYAQNGAQLEFLANTKELNLKRDCAKLLASKGFKFNDGRLFGRVMDYIRDCMVDYGDGLLTIQAAETNGWNEDNTIFAVGKKGITKMGIIDIYTTLSNPKHIGVFESKGDIEGWVNTVSPILDYDLVRFMFYDSMTAPLIKLLAIESHTFEHIGKTRGGKTTVSWTIASAMGNPFEHMVTPANSTVGITAHISAMSDIPTFIEEATTKKAKEVTKGAIYEIANGMEKARGRIDGKMREDIKTFRAVTHITAEGSIKEEMQHAGEMFRLNSMEEVIPYDERLKRIKTKLLDNYGFFFPLYMRKIIKNQDRLKGLYEINFELFEDSEDSLIESSKEVYAGIMLAGQFCEEVFKEMGVPEKDSNEIVLKYFGKCVVGNEIELDHIRALRLINDWVLSNSNSFVQDASEIPDTRLREVYGVVTKKEIRILGTPFKEILRKWDFNSPKMIMQELLKEGITRTNNRNKGQCKFCFNGGSAEGVVIDIKVMRERLGLSGEENIP